MFDHCRNTARLKLMNYFILIEKKSVHTEVFPLEQEKNRPTFLKSIRLLLFYGIPEKHTDILGITSARKFYDISFFN